jgi:hypothetical protein
MTIDGWIVLWSALLWMSAGAFGLVTVFVALRYGRELLRK